MTYEQWVATYRPEPNLFVGPDERPFGNMFETFGKEVEHVFQFDESFIWTIVEAEGEWWLSPGRHRVNRIGYFVCFNPFQKSNPPEDISLED